MIRRILLLAVCAYVMGNDVSAQRARPARYNWSVESYNFRLDGRFLSKERYAGTLEKRPDGTVQWSDVTHAVGQSLDGAFATPQSLAYVNGFRYPPIAEEATKEQFFASFPADALPAKNLVWDTMMFESFAANFAKLKDMGPSYAIPPSNIALAGSGAFQNNNVVLSRRGFVESKGRRLAVLHYDALFNTVNLNLPNGLKMTGRSDYLGDIWMDPKTLVIERGTLYESVCGEVALPKGPPQTVNVVRQGVYERIN